MFLREVVVVVVVFLEPRAKHSVAINEYKVGLS